MNWKAHIIMTILFMLLGAGAIVFFDVTSLEGFKPYIIIFTVFAMLGTLLPDIDHRNSKITMVVQGFASVIALGIAILYGNTIEGMIMIFVVLEIFIAVIMTMFRFIFPHRGFVHTHTMGFLVAAGFGAFFMIFVNMSCEESLAVFLGTIFGFFSHLAADGYVIPKML